MVSRNRHFALFWIGLAGLALLLLAGSLSDVQLMEGKPIYAPAESSESEEISASSEQDGLLPARTSASPWLQGLVTFAFLLLLAYFGFNFFLSVNREKLIVLLVILFFLFAVLSYLPLFVPSGPPIYFEEALPTAAAPLAPTAAPEVVQPPQFLPWLLAAFFTLFLFLAGIWLLRKAFVREEGVPILAQEAEKALSALRSGEDFKNVIIRCYMQMQQFVLDEQGLEREVSMTPGEFENYLVEQGLPAEPLHQLTQIFEEVRYGHKPTSPLDEQKAVECLRQISQNLGNTQAAR